MTGKSIRDRPFDGERGRKVPDAWDDRLRCDKVPGIHAASGLGACDLIGFGRKIPFVEFCVPDYSRLETAAASRAFSCFMITDSITIGIVREV